MKFEAHINGSSLVCDLRLDEAPNRPLDHPLKGAVFCFSCLAPMKVIAGGEKIHGVGGYTEIALPPLEQGQTHRLILAYEADEFVPVNRAWLPLGAYVRVDGEIIELPTLPAGVRAHSMGERAINHTIKTPKDVPLRLCPQPTRFQGTGGTLRAQNFRASSDQFAAVNAWCQRMGQPPLLNQAGAALETRDCTDLPPAGYRLTIEPTGCLIEFGDAAGLFYASLTLATLRRTHQGDIPCGVIDDFPRFEWRGQHLDCARHFYGVEFILDLLDLMALMKLNRFHWHFADDEAFRLHLNNLPELEKTHFRGEGQLIPGVFGGGVRSGGSYSHADVQRVLQRAKDLQIEVMPEIEVPAHALALAVLYPETRDPEDTGQEISIQGYQTNVMNPAMADSWRVWETMAREVAELFPFGTVHIGGDELPADTWMQSPAARALMDAEGLKTAHDLLGWTLNRLASKLQSYGVRSAAWEEASLGSVGIQNNAILFSWSSQGPGLEAARAGYPVVMTPAQHTYFDMAHTDDPDDWGANWAGFISLDDTINWDPVPEDEPELEQKILGVQGAFWSEFTTADHQVKAMLYPRILGLAIKAWQPRQSAQADTLHTLHWFYQPLLEEAGWACT